MDKRQEQATSNELKMTRSHFVQVWAKMVPQRRSSESETEGFAK